MELEPSKVSMASDRERAPELALVPMTSSSLELTNLSMGPKD